MIIEVSAELRSTINNVPFLSAPSVAQLHEWVGRPSRIAEPLARAPLGHRNSCWHVYDDAGVYFNEHHYTRRIQECGIVFRPDEQHFPGTPRNAFNGTLYIAGFEVMRDPKLLPFLKGVKINLALQHFIAGMSGTNRDGFSLNLEAKGERLASGRRSKTLIVVGLSLSWPHDPWGTPVSCST